MAGEITITGVCSGGGGSPGGSDTQVQFNDSGVFGGAAQLFWDKATNCLGIGTSTMSETLNVGGGLLLKTASPRLKLDGVGGIPGFEFYLNSVRKWLCYADSATDRFDFKTNADIRMTILQAGNVGIGVVAPAEKLEVAGAIRMGTTALTNAGTIRWNGTNFEGYSTRWRTLNNDDNAAVYTIWKSGSTYYAKASVISGLGDYSGNVFHTVLQSALDATDDTGGIINFAPGTYSVTGKITGRSDVILQGCGQNWGSKGTIFSLDAAVDMFEFGVTECFEFKHILFDGNDRNQVTLYFHGTGDGTPCQNFHITKCGFKDCRRAISGIYAYDCYVTDTGFTRCGYFANSYYACYVSSGCNAWHFKDCRWETLKGHAFHSGASGNHEFHFIGCKFHGWTSYKYHAINGHVSFGSIVGCFFYDIGASYRAIRSQGDGLCITGNVFENCKGCAIEIVAGANKNSITGNTFYTITNITAHISDAGADTVITGNTVYETNNDLIVHTNSTAIRGLNCAAFSNLVVRDDNIEAMADQAHWTPPPGLYNISCWGPELQLWVNGAWHTSNVGIDGMVYCDGTNQRVYNNAGAAQNVCWQRF